MHATVATARRTRAILAIILISYFMILLDNSIVRVGGTISRVRVTAWTRPGSVNGRGATWYRGVQSRDAGHIAAGDIESDVTFANSSPRSIQHATGHPQVRNTGTAAPRTP